MTTDKTPITEMADLSSVGRDYADADDHRCEWSECDTPAPNRLVSMAHGEEWFCGDHFEPAVEETINQDVLLEVGANG